MLLSGKEIGAPSHGEWGVAVVVCGARRDCGCLLLPVVRQ